MGACRIEIILNVILLVLNIANVFVHGTGSYLLGCIYKQGKRSAQKIFIINLSVCELLMNLMECLRRILELITLSGKQSNDTSEFQDYLLIVMFTGVSFVFYMDMIFITVDRLLNVFLNARYRIYCNQRKAKCLLAITWLIGFITCLSVSLIHYFTEYGWEAFFFRYFYPTVELSFIILAIVTYLFIFKQYQKSLRIPSHGGSRKNQHDKQHESAVQVFRMSRFYVSILLITSFIIFMLIPDLVYLFYGVLQNNESSTLLACCWISYAVSNLIDGWVYIFMQSTVKSLLRIKVQRLCRCTGYVSKFNNRRRTTMLLRSCGKDKKIEERRYCDDGNVAYHESSDVVDGKETLGTGLISRVHERNIYLPTYVRFIFLRVA